jgi:hypothetical protein
MPSVVQPASHRKLSLPADHGQNLVEFALALPLLLLVFLGIMEFGLIVLSYNTIANAAREGARTGIIHPANESGNCVAPAGVIGTAVCRMVSGLDSSTISYQATRGGQSIQVQVSYPYRPITGPIIAVLGVGAINLTTVATMQVE